MTNSGTDMLPPPQRYSFTRIRSGRFPLTLGTVLGLLAGCGGGDHFLRDGGITRRLDGGVSTLNESVEPQTGVAREVAGFLEQALESLRSGQPRASLDTLLEAQMIDGWEQTPKAPAVVFWTGHSYELIGEPNAAIAAFRRVRVQYSDSPFSERAYRRLQRLRQQLKDDPSGY